MNSFSEYWNWKAPEFLVQEWVSGCRRLTRCCPVCPVQVIDAGPQPLVISWFLLAASRGSSLSMMPSWLLKQVKEQVYETLLAPWDEVALGFTGLFLSGCSNWERSECLERPVGKICWHSLGPMASAKHKWHWKCPGATPAASPLKIIQGIISQMPPHRIDFPGAALPLHSGLDELQIFLQDPRAQGKSGELQHHFLSLHREKHTPSFLWKAFP